MKPSQAVMKFVQDLVADGRRHDAAATSAPADAPFRESLEYSVAADPGATRPDRPVRFLTPLDWGDENARPVEWLAHGRIPRGDVSTLSGDGGSGKTTAALQLSAAVARGAPDWLGCCVSKGPVVFLSAEEPEAQLHRLLDNISRRQDFALSDLRDLHIWPPGDLAADTLVVPGGGSVIKPTPLFHQLSEEICRVRPILIVLDNVAAVFPGNQNDRVAVRSFVNLFRGLARRSDAGVLLLDHPSLSGLTAGTGRGGNMDWHNSVRSAMYLKPAADKAAAARGGRVLQNVKNNYAPLFEPVMLERVDGIFVVQGTATPLERAALDAQIARRFLELLELRNASCKPVSDKPGRSSAPHIFAQMDPTYASKAYARAMERLFLARAIVVEESGPPSRRQRSIVRASQAR